MNQEEATGPLRGLRVIDFTHFLSGPYATLILADLGAEVIKIENPGRGDEFRHYPPYIEQLEGEGAPFLWANRNKESVAIDLKSDAGRAVVRDLIRIADIVVENFSTGVMERFGLGYPELAKEQPGLIYCSVSAYGSSGPFADRVGIDPIVQAESGFMSLNGYSDREGVRTGPGVMDLSTGMMAANGILAAVIERYRTGRGQRVETSMYATAMNVIGYSPMQLASDGNWKAGRHGNDSPDTAPTGVLYASDGPIYVACTSTEAFQRFFKALGREDMANAPSLQDKPRRLEQKDHLFAAANEALAKDTRKNWLVKLRAARVPAGEVRTIAESMEAPETKALDIISRIPHPTLGTVANVRLPIMLNKTPLGKPVAAPMLGQQTRDVLQRLLGFDASRIAALDSAGVFGSRLRPGTSPASGESAEKAELRGPVPVA